MHTRVSLRNLSRRRSRNRRKSCSTKHITRNRRITPNRRRSCNRRITPNRRRAAHKKNRRSGGNPSEVDRPSDTAQKFGQATVTANDEAAARAMLASPELPYCNTIQIGESDNNQPLGLKLISTWEDGPSAEVKTFEPKGPTAINVRMGDIIIKVNDTETTSLSFRDTMDVLRSATRPISLKLLKPSLLLDSSFVPVTGWKSEADHEHVKQNLYRKLYADEPRRILATMKDKLLTSMSLKESNTTQVKANTDLTFLLHFADATWNISNEPGLYICNISYGYYGTDDTEMQHKGTIYVTPNYYYCRLGYATHAPRMRMFAALPREPLGSRRVIHFVPQDLYYDVPLLIEHRSGCSLIALRENLKR